MSSNRFDSGHCNWYPGPACDSMTIDRQNLASGLEIVEKNLGFWLSIAVSSVDPDLGSPDMK